MGLLLTVVLAVLFTGLQGLEYTDAGFSMPDGAYGSCFYFSTGFHGLHVLVGTLFIAVGLGRTMLYHFTSQHHIGLEASILYWHFTQVHKVFQRVHLVSLGYLLHVKHVLNDCTTLVLLVP